MGLLIGIGPTLLQWLIAKVRHVFSFNAYAGELNMRPQRWQKIGPLKVSDIMLPVIYSVRVELIAHSSCRSRRTPAVRLPANRRHELAHSHDRHRRHNLAGLAAALPPRLVQEVQLHPRRGSRRRRTGHDLCPLIRRIWRVGEVAPLPDVGGQSCGWQRRLLQRQRRSELVQFLCVALLVSHSALTLYES